MEIIYEVRTSTGDLLAWGLNQSMHAAIFVLGIPPTNLKYLCKGINGDANLPYNLRKPSTQKFKSETYGWGEEPYLQECMSDFDLHT